jgi:hypothetical protein
VLGDGLDTAGVLRPLGPKSVLVDVGLEPVTGSGKPLAESIDVSCRDCSVFRLQTDETGDLEEDEDE